MAAGACEVAVLVPKDALVSQGTSRKVFRVSGDNEAEPVAVTTGSASGLWIAVHGGIKAGDTVIIRGNERLRAGQIVAPEDLEVPPL
jgi:multidrug efflux pump subunit AcrA (membrane-fusion protein)